MKIAITLDSYETFTNIGMAKALAESSLRAEDLEEIARYLMIYAEKHPTEKGGEE